MRLAVLLTLVSGCHLVFELDDTRAPADAAPDVGDAPPAAIERNGKITQRVQNDKTVTLTRTSDIADDEMLIVTIQGLTLDAQIESVPPGFLQMADGTDTCGSATWHMWVYAGRAAGAELEFRFTESAQLFSAIGISYKNVGTAREVLFRSSQQDDLAPSTEVLPLVSGVADGAMVFLSLVANEPITQHPPGLDRISQFDNVVVYDGPSVTNSILPISITVPAGFCIGATEVKLEP